MPCSLIILAININFNYYEILTYIGHSGKVLVMKVFLTVLVLIFAFHSWTKADDIRDFEIEGMSVGDSLLDYFPKYLIDEAINKSSSLYYKNKKYVQIGASYKKVYKLNITSKTYDDLSIVLKPNDNSYKIYSIGGRIFCKDIEICKSKKKRNGGAQPSK